jgi:hypothetical protein
MLCKKIKAKFFVPVWKDEKRKLTTSASTQERIKRKEGRKEGRPRAQFDHGLQKTKIHSSFSRYLFSGYGKVCK